MPQQAPNPKKSIFTQIEFQQCPNMSNMYKKKNPQNTAGLRPHFVKCPELGELLYDWFIDCLQMYARVNQPLCLAQARFLKQRLLERGYEPQAMPNLDGEAGKSWFRRWRKKLRVVIRKKVKHLNITLSLTDNI